MAVVSPVASDEHEDGVLFAIRKPARTISDFDSRTFAAVEKSLNGEVALYSAPDVSERLRIQRGHFLVGPVSGADGRVSVPLSLDAASPLEKSWIWKRMKKRGAAGTVPAASSDVAVFRVTAKFKGELRRWLEERSGLSADFIYPTPWHQPHLERFATSHGRTAGF